MKKLPITLSPVTKHLPLTIRHDSRSNGDTLIANGMSQVTGDRLIFSEGSFS
jgi:hypothetical protein